MSSTTESPCKFCIFGVLSMMGVGVFTLSKLLKYISNKKRRLDLDSSEKLTNSDFDNILKEYSTKFLESKVMEEYLPREFQTEQDLLNLSTNMRYSKGNNDIVNLTKGLSIPVWDLLDRGGKRWRPVLSIFLAESFHHTFNDIKYIAALCEMIHNASLIMDDIEDSSLVRRDKPCVHLIYGMDISANAGTFIYFLPMQQLIKKTDFSDELKYELLKIYIDEMVHIHIGQGWDIMWHNLSKSEGFVPTEEQYLQMTAHKTGVLARLVVRMTCQALKVDKKTTDKLSLFAERIGIAFQIQDDLLNIEPTEKYLKTKGYCGEDIHEGKMSIMVIHCLNNSGIDDRNRLLKILSMKTEDQLLIKEAIEIIRKTDSLNYAKEVGKKLVQEAWQEVKNDLPLNSGTEKIRLLAEFLINRNI